MVDLATLTAAVEAGDRRTAVAITQSAIDEGMAPQLILDAMTKAMEGCKDTAFGAGGADYATCIATKITEVVTAAAGAASVAP